MAQLRPPTNVSARVAVDSIQIMWRPPAGPSFAGLTRARGGGGISHYEMLLGLVLSADDGVCTYLGSPLTIVPPPTPADTPAAHKVPRHELLECLARHSLDDIQRLRLDPRAGIALRLRAVRHAEPPGRGGGLATASAYSAACVLNLNALLTQWAKPTPRLGLVTKHSLEDLAAAAPPA